MKRQNIHVGHSSLTNTIYAGSISKDKTLWLSNKTDVTQEALIAVALFLEQGGDQVIHKNGAPAFEVSIKHLSAAPSHQGGEE